MAGDDDWMHGKKFDLQALQRLALRIGEPDRKPICGNPGRVRERYRLGADY